MQSFNDFINLKEEVTPVILDPKGRNDIRHEGTRDSINTALSSIQSDCLTPYIGLERVRKVLAYFHISIPGVQFLEGEHGIKAFEVSQYGIKTGMKDNGEVVTAEDSPYFIVFEWMYAYSGSYNIRCSMVNADKLQDRLDSYERLSNELSEEEEKKNDKEFIRKQYARAYADSNHKMTDDAKKMVKSKIKALSEARLKKNELSAMQDAIRMQASLQGRKVKIPKPKARRPKDETKYLDSMKMDHWKMKQQVRRTSFLPEKPKPPAALIPKIDTATGTNLVPRARPARPYKMPSFDLDTIGKEGGSSGPASQTMQGHRNSIDHNSARLRTGIPRPAVESDFEKFVKKYNETGKKEWIDKAKRWMTADYAYHKVEYPDASELELKLRKQAIQALEDAHSPSKLAKIGGMMKNVFKRKTVKEDVMKEGILRKIDKALGSPLQKRRIDRMNTSGKKNRSSAEITDRSTADMPGRRNTHLTGGSHPSAVRKYIKGQQERQKQLKNKKIALKDVHKYADRDGNLD